jgi:hypothetical protein
MNKRSPTHRSSNTLYNSQVTFGGAVQVGTFTVINTRNNGIEKSAQVDR